MFVADGHEDIAYNALHHARDLRDAVEATRAREAAAAQEDEPLTGKLETAMVGLPDLRRGGVGLVFATIFALPADADAMTADGQAQMRYYADLVSTTPGLRLITTQAELAALVADYNAAATPEERPVGLVLLMEGADPLRTPADLAAWQADGLRIVGTSWRGTRYAGGTGQPGGLTDLGNELLAEMERLGMILDLSHMAEESVWQALDRFSGTIIASHSNSREYVPTDRHLTDDMVKAIVARDGVIGAVLHSNFLVDGWRPGMEPVTLDAVVRHIDRVCQLAGSARHSAIGSDFDGGRGVESTPVEFDTVADLARIGDALSAKGYTQDDVAAVLGGNWLRTLQRGLPA